MQLKFENDNFLNENLYIKCFNLKMKILTFKTSFITYTILFSM